jgi:hypothetical protein
MSGNGSEKPGFQIGLAMAGAVSAGAYSAGVFDFLIEALNDWQRPRNGERMSQNMMSSCPSFPAPQPEESSARSASRRSLVA